MSAVPAIPSMQPRSRASEVVTNGFRVSVEPSYLPEQSDPEARKFLFAYRIRIGNESGRAAQLVARHWLIIDSMGRRREVDGEGIIGKQPLIRSGHFHEYTSHCDLQTSWGTMEGHYVMRAEGDEQFTIAIARFFLVAEARSQVAHA